MNKVTLIGNLTRDPELAETVSGVSVCRFTVAVNRPYTQGDGERQVDFFNCTAWRGLGESVSKYCKKGSKVAVSGSIQMRTYEGNDGVNRLAVDVIAQDVEFLTPKGERSEGRESERASISRSSKTALQSFDDDGDLPF